MIVEITRPTIIARRKRVIELLPRNGPEGRRGEKRVWRELREELQSLNRMLGLREDSREETIG